MNDEFYLELAGHRIQTTRSVRANDERRTGRTHGGALTNIQRPEEQLHVGRRAAPVKTCEILASERDTHAAGSERLHSPYRDVEAWLAGT